MGTTRSSQFKVRAEEVESHFGIPPKEGALLYLKSDYQLIYGDGYNWLDIGPGANKKAAVALELKSNYSGSFVAGVEQQMNFYDTEIYNYLAKFVPIGGNQIKITAAFGVDYYAEYSVSADVSNVVLTVVQKYDGLIRERIIPMVEKNTPQMVQAFGTFIASPSHLWRVFAKTDKNCTITSHYLKIGMHERT